MRKLQKEILSKPTNTDFFNLFFKSQSVTYLIGAFGQVISGLTEFYFIFSATGGYFPIFQKSNFLSIILGLLAIYVFEVLGVRVYLVRIVRQIVNRHFKSWTDKVLFVFNILFCLAFCGTNLWFSLLGQTASFHKVTNVRVTDKTYNLDSTKLIKIDAVNLKYNQQDSLTKSSYQQQVDNKTVLFDDNIAQLKNNRWAVRENKSEYDDYTDKIDDEVIAKNEALAALDEQHQVNLATIETNRQTEIDRITQSFDKRINDIESTEQSSIDLWVMVQQYTRPILIVFILLSWIAIIYQEIFMKGAGQEVEVKNLSYRPLLLWVLLVGWYDKFYHWFYGVVTRNIGLDKYRYSQIRLNDIDYSAKQAITEEQATQRPQIAAIRQIGFNTNRNNDVNNGNNELPMNETMFNVGNINTSGVEQLSTNPITNDDRTTMTVDSNIRNCKHCNQPFTFKHWNKRYCSDECRIANWEARTGRTVIKGRK